MLTSSHRWREGSRRTVTFALLILCAILSLAGTDLILPAVPQFPILFGTSETTAQFVLASYVAGTALGLLLFGLLADRFSRRTLVVSSLLIFAASSFACVFSPNIWTLIALRFIQGGVSAAAPVFAPGIITQLFSERAGVRAIGFLGSVESLVPALAPIAGVFLIARFGWGATFEFIGALALLVALLIIVIGLPSRSVSSTAKGSYSALLRNLVFMRYALSQAMTVGGLIAFVFGAPAVIIGSMDGTLQDFIVMQVCGVTGFIVAANLTSNLAERWGAERMILIGSTMALASAVALAIYGFTGNAQAGLLPVLFTPMNIGLGLRGPLGFYRGIVASGTNHDRGSALIVFFILAMTSGGTILAAPFIAHGLWALGIVTCLIHVISVALLLLLPKLPDSE